MQKCYSACMSETSLVVCTAEKCSGKRSGIPSPLLE